MKGAWVPRTYSRISSRVGGVVMLDIARDQRLVTNGRMADDDSRLRRVTE